MSPESVSASADPSAGMVTVSPLTIRDLTVAYQRRPVVWDVDYTAPSGKLVAVESTPDMGDGEGNTLRVLFLSKLL